MTFVPQDQEPLVDFLRQHRPIPPPASADLELQIVKAVESLPAWGSQVRGLHLSRRGLWQASSAIAASLLIILSGDRDLKNSNPSPAELASLEAFLETSWDGVVNDSQTLAPANEWFSPN